MAPPTVLAKINAATADAWGNCAGIAVAASGGDSTTSASYVSMAATSSFSFTKYLSTTSIKIDLHATFAVSAVSTSARFGVLINGVDYDICQMFINEANSRRNSSGSVPVALGLGAGVYTIQARWKRVAGAGTLQRFVTDDWLALCAAEVAP